MSIEEILREMRSEEWHVGDAVPQVEKWADAIEAAMREPVAYISHTSQGDVLDWEPQFDAPSHTKLYAFPPDAQAEIERLRELVANDAYAASFQSMKQYRNALLSALAGKEKENV